MVLDIELEFVCSVVTMKNFSVTDGDSEWRTREQWNAELGNKAGIDKVVCTPAIDENNDLFVVNGGGKTECSGFRSIGVRLNGVKFDFIEEEHKIGETPYTLDSENSSGEEEFDGQHLDHIERMESRQLRNAMRESRKTAAFEDEMHNRYGYSHVGAGSSHGLTLGVKRGISRSQSVKDTTKSSSRAEWWINYGEEAPHLRKIMIKVLSQTCSSSGCERNWSTWSLIHTKLRNRLAIEKLHKLVYYHYNMRLRVRNMMHRNDDDYYSPIDLNHIFDDDDILEEWTRENEQPILSDDILDSVDRVISQEEDDHATTSAPRRRNEERSRNSRGKNVASENLSDDSDDSDESGDGTDKGNNGSRGDHSYSGGSSGRYKSVDEQMQSLGLRGIRQVPRGYSYGSSNDNRIAHEVAYNPRQELSGTHGHFDGYLDYLRNRHHDHTSSTTSGIGYHGTNYGSSGGFSGYHGYDYSSGASGARYRAHDYGSSDSAGSSSGYRGFGYYRYHDDSLSSAYPIHSTTYNAPNQPSQPQGEQLESSRFAYPHGLYHYQHDSHRSDTDDFVPPRHSTWLLPSHLEIVFHDVKVSPVCAVQFFYPPYQLKLVGVLFGSVCPISELTKNSSNEMVSRFIEREATVENIGDGGGADNRGASGSACGLGSQLGWCLIPATDIVSRLHPVGSTRSLSYRLRARDGTRGHGVVNVAVKLEGSLAIVHPPRELDSSNAPYPQEMNESEEIAIGIPVTL
ncbi:hypothetical protein BUALT_Bualt05G0060700 [Buddleja alternifolia]|uniref:HAT C-terminal dimerisation domain-containing protein n=1 Tax=Buddleja alternifolia TaxID=168488 RepID=A0AAV6XT43_9LAMI|nr:hypothetical protein BUALT_Bualt05G0060700 [Buddleja alternifolia]